MIEILLVDHYRLVRSGLKALLDAEEDMQVVAEAGTAEAAVSTARSARPDVVVLNADLPGMGGLEVTRRLGRLEPAPRVIALGAQRDGPLPTCLLEVGARGLPDEDLRADRARCRDTTSRAGRPLCGHRRGAEPRARSAARCADAAVALGPPASLR